MMNAYYMTQRPPMPGAMPVGFDRFEEFDGITYIPRIGHTAYAMVYYDRALSEQEISDYELVPDLIKVELTPAEIRLILDRLNALPGSGEADDETLETAADLFAKLVGGCA